MATLTDFVVALIQSVLELVVTFADVALSDPLSTINFVFGNLFILASVGAFAYLVLGALGAEIGIGATARSRSMPPQQE
ncbi:hypothetical protein E6P09_01540 [Haloferax mediterranei ATCC 33500]|uniref:Uncharacterized protein n=1 Tax=Haloferax mediterranei (strain ATCC 33500 / DSM 1411 / JCM 8866 / NBRC 14739 / NCIMB 2177 / R-4) TaxID=523841 RepID=I3R663_HALMT|nr:hypothetical protein [Haloferax mediterranei]AFK19723.1 hypothetical protein HFX_2031 [Haloferax mediterranei ATCC 33500]AHZ23111.1 hypothetical protein BM92_10900 [Haloferax mediterranei ATCC 33500]EMA00045.1 hypothetical protein C439_11933 [Haloferax mediterranei ATCC 33500]MDX5987532.1 hypothetical protein [Haloferax mediterranei ATCC 33500]QCQ74029.1 hypothetical protein E6P09_01540 [Haloferax mediterranei ATCC 33500]